MSNLGVLDVPSSYGPLTMAGLWGPAVSLGVEAEHVLGVTTFAGSLRIVNTSFYPVDAFLDLVVSGRGRAGTVVRP